MLRGPGFRRLFTGVHIRSDVTVWPTTYIEAALHVSVFEKSDILIEYDGQQHRTSLDQWDTDIAR